MLGFPLSGNPPVSGFAGAKLPAPLAGGAAPAAAPAAAGELPSLAAI